MNLHQLKEKDPTFKDIINEYEDIARKEGWEEGREEGEEVGIEKGLTSVAKRMLEAGVDLKNISLFTGLSEEKINSLIWWDNWSLNILTECPA